MKLVSLPNYPIPEGAIVGTIRTTDGVNLRYSRWLGPSRARGTIVLLQGRAEFIEKYFEVVLELRSRGFAIVTFDWRGQGLSDRLLPDNRKGYVESFSQYDLDFDAVLEQVVKTECRPPFLGLAHSTGGAILLRAAVGGMLPMDRLILTSPMIGLPYLGRSNLARFTLRALVAAGMGSSYIPGGRAEIMDLRPFAGNRRTSDTGRYARCADLVAAEPALGLGSPTIGWTAAAVEAVREFADADYARRIEARSLVVTPGGDQIVSTAASRALAARSSRISYVLVETAKHELLMERDEFRSQFWAAFDAFIL
jgi:lysophospholipase